MKVKAKRERDTHKHTLAASMLLAFPVNGVCWCCCQACHRARLEASITDEATIMPPTPTLPDDDGPGGDGADGGDGRCGTWACVGVLASILFLFPPLLFAWVRRLRSC